MGLSLGLLLAQAAARIGFTRLQDTQLAYEDRSICQTFTGKNHDAFL